MKTTLPAALHLVASLLIVSLPVVPLNAFSQHSRLRFSKDFSIAENEYKNQTLSHSIHHNNLFYSVTNSGAGAGKWLFTKLYDTKFAVTLSKFDADMKLLKEVELEGGDKKFGPLIPQLIFFHNKVFLAYFKNDNTSSFNLYLAPVNENDLSLGEAKKISTIQQENVGLLKIEAVLDAGLLSFTPSPDNSKLLVAAKIAPNKIQTTILDKDLGVVKQVTSPVALPDFEIPSAVLTNDDKTLLVLRGDQETKILGIGADGKKTESRLSATGSLRPQSTRASLGRDGKSIYVYSSAGSTDSEEPWCTGLLLAQVDLNTLKLSKPQAYPFTPDFIQSIAESGGGEKRKKDFFLYNFVPALVEMENGTIAITGSPRAVNYNTSNSAPNRNNQTHTVATTIIHVGPVLVFFPDKNGSSLDHVTIPRRIKFSRSARSGNGAIQLVQSPTASLSNSGYLTTSRGDELLVLYTDNETNLSRDASEKTVATTSAGNLVLAEAVVRADKKLGYRKMVGETEQKRVTFYLGNIIPTSSQSVIFPIGKEGAGFKEYKTIFTNWCFLDIP